jgi:very-short-patch-repair endonuclease
VTTVVRMLLGLLGWLARKGFQLIRRQGTYRRIQAQAASQPGSQLIEGCNGRKVFLSPIEAVLYHALTRRGLCPAAQIQVRGYFIDLGFPELRVGVEADGAAYHSGPARRRDRRRDGHLARDGWTILRFSGSDIRRDPDGCARVIAEHVEAARYLRDRQRIVRAMAGIVVAVMAATWLVFRR